MVQDLPRGKLLISGTMRGGSSLVSNILNAHSEVLVVSEYIHFFRFLYRKSEPVTESSIKQSLEEMRLRLFYRYDIPLDSSTIFADVIASGISYQNLYNAILRHLLNQTGKLIGGEDAALNWTTIPEYFRLFPEGKVVQIVRDPRAVLASWHKLSYQKVGYLDAIFNCIDNMDKCLTYQSLYSDKDYMSVRYEDVVGQPEVISKKLCEFLEIEFQPLMIAPKQWDSVFDGVLIKRGWSSHTGSMKNRGFDESRLTAWESILEDWELCLCEHLVNDRLCKFGYEFSGKMFTQPDFMKGIDYLRNDPFLAKRYMKWFLSNEGSEGHIDDPTDPFSWGATGENKSKFVDTPKGKAFLKELELIRGSQQKQ